MTTRQSPSNPRAWLDAFAPLARITLCALTVVQLTGCMTMARANHQKVWITSEPVGAAVTVDGRPAGVTPTQVIVTRRDKTSVSVVRDSLRADTTLARNPTPHVLWYLLFSVPGVLMGAVDLMSGAALNVEDAHVVLRPAGPAAALIAAAPLPPVKKALPVIDLPLKRHDRLRLDDPHAKGGATHLVVDSADTASIYGRSLSSADASRPQHVVVVATDDTRRVALYREPDRRAGGLAMTRGSVIAIAPFLAIPQGAAVAMLAYPAGYVTGATLAEPRWSPREAHRVGSPLLLDDSVAVRFEDAGRDTVRGRLVNLDRTDMLLASSGTLLRIPRKDIGGVRRANGFHYAGAALAGTILGAMVGTVACKSTDLCRRSGLSQGAFTLTATLGGLLVSPSFAPKRWSEVERW